MEERKQVTAWQNILTTNLYAALPATCHILTGAQQVESSITEATDIVRANELLGKLVSVVLVFVLYKTKPENTEGGTK